MADKRPDVDSQSEVTADSKREYVAPVMETIADQLAALLGSTQCGAGDSSDPGCG